MTVYYIYYMYVRTIYVYVYIDQKITSIWDFRDPQSLDCRLASGFLKKKKIMQQSEIDDICEN